jgi:branched-chain amino acid transport system substrate-binding protein
MAHFAYRDLGARRAAVLENLNEVYSKELGRVFKETFIALGGKIVGESEYKSLDTDFTEMLKGVKESGPDVVFLPGYSRDSVLIIRQARQLELSATFLGGDGWGEEMHGMAGRILEGSFHSTHWDPAVEHEANQAFLKLYRERYGDFVTLDSAAPMTFDAVGLIVAAARKAGSTDRDKIREALAATRDYQGATGRISFNENGDPESKDAVLLEAKEGAWVFVKSLKP